MPASRIAQRWAALSLPWRLTLSCSAALLVSAVLVLGSSLLASIEHESHELSLYLNQEGQILVPALARAAEAGDLVSIEHLVSTHAAQPGVASISWVDARGRALNSSHSPALAHAPAWFADMAAMPPIRVERTVPGHSGVLGTVTLTADLAPALDAVWNATLGHLEVLVFGIGLLMTVMLSVVTGALRPLSGLAAAARRFGRGDHQIRASAEGSPEVVQVIRAFNTMAERIEGLFKSLRETQQRSDLLATVVKHSSDAIVTVDPDGQITSLNAATVRMFGYGPEEAIGQHCSLLDLADPDQAHAPPAPWGLRREASEGLRRTRAGLLIHVATSVAPLYDDRGHHLGAVLVMRDLSGQKQAENDLAREKERAEVTLASIADGVVTTDMAARVEYLNPTAERLTGWYLAEARGRDIAEVIRMIDGATGRAVPGSVESVLRERVAAPGNTGAMLLARDGTSTLVEDSAAPLRDGDGNLLGAVLVFRDVSERERLSLQLSWQASHDPVTGLANRAKFDRDLRALVENARSTRSEHALLYLDLDQFKVVNDTCGHAAGDELLRQVSNLLVDTVRDSDTLARVGGDEFAVLFHGCSLERAVAVSEKLRDAVAAFRFHWQGNNFTVGVSGGLVSIDGERSSTDLLGAADAACYAAKDHGRNRIQVYRPEDSEPARRLGEMAWVGRINRAMEEGRFRLNAQRIARIGATDEAEHHELLLTLIDEKGERVPPMAFIPAAERYGLMPAIDRHVVSMAFSAHAAAHAGVPVERQALFSINLSGSSLGQEGFLEFVRGEFTRHQVSPHSICFEVTETAAIANLSAATGFMRELKAMGCRFSLDDFGSGLSSFSYLKNLPVDYLKIDGSFVKDMAIDPIDCAMVEAINSVGHTMGLKTIAEFVENELTLGMLKTVGVDYAQGYGIARPRPLEDVLGLTALDMGRPALAVVRSAPRG